MKTAVIFGVTGQDGSFLSELLLSKQYKVIGVARRSSLPNTSRINLLLNIPIFELVSGDVTDPYSVHRILQKYKPDEVYNLAAQSHVGTSFVQPSTTWDITGKGCLNVLEVMRETGGRFYQASSSEMFGDAFTRTRDGNKVQDETTPFRPQSPYAIAKLAAHHSVRLYRQSYDIFACSGILFNHESERRGENFVTRKITKWVADFVRWCEKQGLDPESRHFRFDEDYIHSNRECFPKLRLGNLDAKRDWGYAADYVQAMWLMLQQDKPDDYIICTGETHSVEEFLIEAFKCINIVDYDKFMLIDEKFKRPSEVPYLRGDCSKAKKRLNWKPTHSFKELVEIMLQADLSRVSDYVISCSCKYGKSSAENGRART